MVARPGAVPPSRTGLGGPSPGHPRPQEEAGVSSCFPACPSAHPRPAAWGPFPAPLPRLCALRTGPTFTPQPSPPQEATEPEAPRSPHLSLRVQPPPPDGPVRNGGLQMRMQALPRSLPAGIPCTWAPRPPLPGSPRASGRGGSWREFPAAREAPGRRVSTPDAGTEPGEHVARASPRQVGLADGLRGLQTRPWGRPVPVFRGKAVGGRSRAGRARDHLPGLSQGSATTCTSQRPDCSGGPASRWPGQASRSEKGGPLQPPAPPLPSGFSDHLRAPRETGSLRGAEWAGPAQIRGLQEVGSMGAWAPGR